MPAQTPYGNKPYKGPRALGLIELPANGRPHFIPIAILVNGQFYDASVYKADPVPMALWFETVYEGFKTGVSQGLFTVTSAQQNHKTDEWIAEGNWASAQALAKEVTKKPGSSIPRGMEDDEGPPVLRHSGASKPEPPPPASAPPTATSNPPAAPTTTTPTPASTEQKSPAPAQTSASTPPAPAEGDPSVPVLRRGKPAPTPEEPLDTSGPALKSAAKPSAPSAANPATPAAAAKPAVQLIAAISDSAGPEPRPYAYDMKPDQEQQFREKMLSLASNEVTARAKKFASDAEPQEPVHATARRSRAKVAGPQPQFGDIQLRIFDLSSSNEPVLVLTANAQMPSTSSSSLAHRQYSIALVEREDINGDFHKVFSEVTDSDHLDVLPRYELIDAVDADGDGRGELLFQQISDDGSTFGIYRVIGNQLYQLFQTAP